MDIYIRKGTSKFQIENFFIGHEIIKNKIYSYVYTKVPSLGFAENLWTPENKRNSKTKNLKTYFTTEINNKEYSFSTPFINLQYDYYVGLKIKNIFKFKKERVSSKFYKKTFSLITIKPLFRY